MTDAENKDLEIDEQAQETQEIETGDPAQTEQVSDDTQPSSEVSETLELEKELSEAETAEEQESIAFKLKNKFKAKANEAEATAEELKQQLQASREETKLLKSALSGDDKPKKMPDQFDYDSDEDYQKDMQAFIVSSNEEVARKILAEEREAEHKRQLNSRQQERLDEIENKHITRAAKFIQNSKVDEEEYSKTQAKVSEVFGQGFLYEIMDFDNSEQIIFELGKNPKKMGEFIDLFNTKSAAAAFRDFTRYADSFGKVQLPKTIEPDESLERGAGGSMDYQSLINSARAASDTNEVIRLKREARSKGISFE